MLIKSRLCIPGVHTGQIMPLVLVPLCMSLVIALIWRIHLKALWAEDLMTCTVYGPCGENHPLHRRICSQYQEIQVSVTYLTIIPRVHVGYEAIIISYPTSASSPNRSRTCGLPVIVNSYLLDTQLLWIRSAINFTCPLVPRWRIGPVLLMMGA